MTINDPMMTYPIGRFSINVPLTMKQAARTARFRGTEVTEIAWPQVGNTEQYRRNVWEVRVNSINKNSPSVKASSLIETRDIPNTGRWSKALLFYPDPDITRVGDWEVLVDYGARGAWFKYHGKVDAREKMLEWVLDIARAYKPINPAAPLPKENGFYLEHGYIALPYRSQEETYARFEGHPLELKLEFKTTAVHKVSESGLVDRLAASLAMNFAPGVDIDKIRSGKRNVAGIAGEEVILRGTQDGKSELNFIWLFTGKADSGDAPKISIEMEAPDSQLDKKLKVWDALLDSIKPIGR